MSLRRAGYEVVTPCLLPCGDERDKSADTLFRLWQHMVRAGLERTSTVVALGGGVVGDLTGFAASTYMRGISLVQIPTTLLAQVDAAIGGKTAIDLPSAKNIVGSFYQPRAVIVDVEALSSLAESRTEIRNGFAEVIKYAMIQDTTLFKWLEQNLGNFFESVSRRRTLRNRELAFLETVIVRSALVKAKVVEQDERETKGKRMILNYGHTFAHSFEAASHYRMPHGEAVALGMACAARMARRRGFFSPEGEERQNRLLRIAGLPTQIPRRFRVKELIGPMKLDKKRKAGKLRFILPERIGRVRVAENVPPSEIQAVLQELKGVKT